MMLLIAAAAAAPPPDLEVDPDLMAPDPVQVRVVDDAEGRALLTVSNGTGAGLEAGTLNAKVHAGHLSWEWTEDLPALDASQSMEVALQPPGGALFDERQRG